MERFWGVLEQYWSGELLYSIDKIIGLAKTMTYKKISPIVNFVKKSYNTGVKLSKKEMKKVEVFLNRKIGLEKYSIIVLTKIRLG